MAQQISSTTGDASIRANALNLQKLLSRLQAALSMSALGHRNTPTTWHERARLGSNLQYARSLLLQLEQQTQSRTDKAPTWRQQTGNTDGLSAGELQLREKKVLIRRLNQRLRELEQRDEGGAERSDGGDGEGEGEDLLAEYGIRDETVEEPAIKESPKSKGDFLSPDASDSILRLRNGASQLPPTDIAHSTSSDAQPAAPDSEALLSRNRLEQESLTESLVDMASRLKAGAKQFGQALEEERSILDRAVAGLDRNSTGMEAAGRFMKSLTRQTEGKGWFGRMKLYLIIGVEILVVLVVLLLPKLRF